MRINKGESDNMEYLIRAIERSSMTENELCEIIGIKEEIWKKKLLGELEFTVSDILKLQKALSLSGRETELIFLTDHSRIMRIEK